MVAIIVAAHGESAPALLATAKMILGDFTNVFPVSFMPGEGPEELMEKYQKITADFPAENSTLLLVDLFGGSPYNAAARFAAERENTDVVSGVNVPMLLEVIGASTRNNATLELLVKKAQQAGTKGIRSFQDLMNPPASRATGIAPLASASAAGSATASAPLASSQSPATEQPSQGIPGGHMDVTFLRIDSRLIHGQVAGSWVNNVNPQTLIAASDSAAQDHLRKTLLLQVAPSHVKTNVLDIAKTGRVYNNPKYTGMRTMVVVENPQDVLRLLDEGVEVKEVNVGGVTFKTGMHQISEAVYASDEDITAYKELAQRGIKMVIQQVPNSGREDMMKKLQEKGLLS
ncbi:MAG: mannose/fructose/sorbose PTS transporter subunit IIA [Rothia sp. (in: high G+C Gram-positive bacteria)]|nr:mannose/fructose/sorbose PTS transporter subunit IIA [Rothia sp. (in: high G+C Gram-positive bacteria)]